MRLLITRPNHDIVTGYLSAWSNDLIKIASESDIQIIDLKNNSASRTNFESYLRKQKINFVFLNGHGNEKIVTGFKNEPLVMADDNDFILKDCIVHALSCESSLELGPKSVKSGAKAYIGYKFPFTFITEKSNECRPLHDKFANIFKDPAIEIPKCLLNGKSPKESYEKGIEKYKQALLLKSISLTDQESEQVRFALFNNLKGLSLND